ncbi:MAG: regulator of sigma E protease [Anaerolineaceae bacterium]|nr:MAG: regulator of sigma E protease [Anaerolineaceae bacterium]
MDESVAPKIYTCYKCGLESAVERAFARERAFPGARVKFLCPKCQVKRHQQSTLIFYVLIPALGIGLTLLDIKPLASVARILLELTTMMVLVIPLIFVHELAHTAVAALTGLRVFAVLLGSGRSLVAFRWLGINWNVRVLPVGGATLISGPRSRGYRIRLFFTYLAGPLTHLALMAGFFFLMVILYLGFQGEWLWRMAINGMALNGILFLVNIFPKKFSSNAGHIGTDGWQLLHLFSMSEKELNERDATYYILETVDAIQQSKMDRAKQWIERGLTLHPQHPMMVNVLGFFQVHAREYAAARETFLQVLSAPGELKPEVRYMAMNNIAFSNMVLNDVSLLPQADEYSAQAYQNMPWEPLIAGTRGAVLVRMGRVEDGMPLLRTAFASNPDKKGKAAEACFLAEAEWRRGNMTEARRWAGTARGLDPACPYLPETERRLGEPAPEKRPQ